MSRPLLDLALEAARLGFSVIPPVETGEKRPLACYHDDDGNGTWLHPPGKPPGDAKFREWYGPMTGIGLRCGSESGGLECFEFDCRTTYDQFKETALACGLGDVVARIESGYLEETPGGGIHWFYFAAEIRGNTKLARRPGPAKSKAVTLIETKGDNGFAIIAPSGGKVHPTGNPYVLTAGSLGTIETIRCDERDALWELARSFDAMPRPAAEPPPRGRPPASGSMRPGDAYNASTTWADILGPAKWTHVYSRGETGYWRRPDKDIGVSATTNHGGSGLLYVFTSSTSFDSEKSHTKFGAYAVLNHGGNYTSAAKCLADLGYGKEKRTVQARGVLRPTGTEGAAGLMVATAKGVGPALRVRREDDDQEQEQGQEQAQPDPTPPPPDDSADLKARIVAAVDQGGWASLYESPDFLRGLARLEVNYPDKFTGIMATLRGMRKFTASDFKRAIQPYRDAEDAKLRASKAGWIKNRRDPARYNDEGTFISVDRISETGDVVREPIAMFSAKIIADVIRDDGSEDPERLFRVRSVTEGVRGSKVVEVKAEDFDAMAWVTKLLGPGYKIVVGRDNKAHAAYAIKHLSGTIPEVRTYTTTGWRSINDEWVYLHGGGGIRATGNDATISVDLSGATCTKYYRLPDPPRGQALHAAIRASLGILRLGQEDRPMSRGLAAALLAFTFRAAIGPAGFSLQIYGLSGCRKSSVAALSQQHYGKEMHPKKFPASWEKDTPISIGESAALCAHAVMVVDDFIPRGSDRDISEKHKAVANFLQGIGNEKGRARAGIRGGVVQSPPPACSPISTQEVRVKFESGDARTIPIRVTGTDKGGNGTATIDVDALSACQADASAGLYAATMAGFVQWLSGRLDSVLASRDAEVAAHRQRVASPRLHTRTPENIGELCFGAETFLRFAVDSGAIDQAEADRINATIQAWLSEATDQLANDRDEAGDTGTNFLSLLASSLLSGKSFLSSKETNDVPDGMEEQCGWRQELKWQGNDIGQTLVWTSWTNGDRIGWIDGEFVYLEPKLAFTAVRKQALAMGENFPLSMAETYKLLLERNCIRPNSGDKRSRDGNRTTSRIKIKAIGAQRDVYPIPIGMIWPDTEGEPGDDQVEESIR